MLRLIVLEKDTQCTCIDCKNKMKKGDSVLIDETYLKSYDHLMTAYYCKKHAINVLIGELSHIEILLKHIDPSIKGVCT